MRFHEIRNGMGGLSPARPTARSVLPLARSSTTTRKKKLLLSNPARYMEQRYVVLTEKARTTSARGKSSTGFGYLNLGAVKT